MRYPPITHLNDIFFLNFKYDMGGKYILLGMIQIDMGLVLGQKIKKNLCVLKIGR